MTNKEVQQKLRESYLFSSTASPLPFYNFAPDVSELNKKVSLRIESMIKDKIQNPTKPLAGLVFGGAGSGKTHMLSRILTRTKNISEKTLFVSVRAFKDPENAMQDMLSGFIVNMYHKTSENEKIYSPFDMMIKNFFERFSEKNPDALNEKILSNLSLNFDIDENEKSEINNENEEQKNSNTFIRKFFKKFLDKNKNTQSISKSKKIINPVNYLCKEIHGIDKRFAYCLLAYFKANFENDYEGQYKKDRIVEWIRTGLSNEECKELGLPPRDTETMSSLARESDAEKFLISLGLVLQYSDITMVVCFDQLDGMIEKELINAWGNSLSFLINNVLGTIPFVFVRADTWIYRFSNNLDESVLERISAATMTMQGCNVEEAKLLIKTRIESYFNENESAEIYNALLNRVKDKLKSGLTPRNVIRLANDEIWNTDWTSEAQEKTNLITTTSTKITPLEKSNENTLIIDDNSKIKRTLDEAFQEKCSEVTKSPYLYPPDSKVISLVIELWLSTKEEFTIERSKNVQFKLFGNYKKLREFVLMTTMSKQAIQIIKIVEKGIDFMKKKTNNQNEFFERRCFFIGEDQIIKAGFKTTRQKLKDLEKAGGFVILLGKQTRIPVYALADLISEVDNGNITLYLSGGERAATREDLKLYLKEFKFTSAEKIEKLFNYITTPPEVIVPLKSNEEIMNQILLRLLNDSPINIISGKFALESLNNKNISISYGELLNFFRNNKNFYVMESKDDFQIGLNNEHQKL